MDKHVHSRIFGAHKHIPIKITYSWNTHVSPGTFVYISSRVIFRTWSMWIAHTHSGAHAVLAIVWACVCGCHNARNFAWSHQMKRLWNWNVHWKSDLEKNYLNLKTVRNYKTNFLFPFSFHICFFRETRLNVQFYVNFLASSMNHKSWHALEKLGKIRRNS